MDLPDPRRLSYEERRALAAQGLVTFGIGLAVSSFPNRGDIVWYDAWPPSPPAATEDNKEQAEQEQPTEG